MPLQDGLGARAKLFKRNCRQNRTRACGLESANAPIGRSGIPRASTDCSRVGWTSATTRDRQAHEPANNLASDCSAGWRQAPGGS